MTRNIAFVGLLTLAACGQAPEEFVDDGLESADELDSKSDASGNATYYSVIRDTRRCVSPLCGGWMVKRLNQTKTKCANGRYAEECYAAEADLSQLHLNTVEAKQLDEAMFSGRAIIRGALEDKLFEELGKLGRFIVTEAWIAGLDSVLTVQPHGIYYRVKRLLTACGGPVPCPDFSQAKLNSSVNRTITSVVLPEGTPEGVWEAFGGSVQTAQGVLAVGENKRDARSGAQSLYANQFYGRVEGSCSVLVCPAVACIGGHKKDNNGCSTCVCN